MVISLIQRLSSLVIVWGRGDNVWGRGGNVLKHGMAGGGSMAVCVCSNWLIYMRVCVCLCTVCVLTG